MRFGAKALITAALAGPAMAALILTGAGAANAATTTSSSGCSPRSAASSRTSSRTSSGGPVPEPVPEPVPQNQFPFQQGQWDLNGPNTLQVSFEVSTYDYAVNFTQQGSCLGGWLTDQWAPITGPIHGTVFGDSVTFSFRYGFGSKQGTRTFTGTINQWGHVSGTWWETGSEHASGNWSLTKPAFQNCQMNFHQPAPPQSQQPGMLLRPPVTQPTA